MHSIKLNYPEVAMTMNNQEIIKKFHEGHCTNAYEVFGAHLKKENGKKGVIFTVYAPHAKEVQVVGPFNRWFGENHRLIKDHESGVFSLFVEGAKENDLYKYLIWDENGKYHEKSDPYGYYSERRPAIASIVVDLEKYKWQDKKWMKERSRNFDKKMNIYEVHAGSWKRKDFSSIENVVERDKMETYTYRELAEELIPYVKKMGYSHIEFMPLNEHPFDGSWGNQAHGYFSATSRYGSCADLMYLIDQCHQNEIGVILDMVPVHFVKDNFGLAYFDGSPLYEYGKEEDANSEWGTLNFDLWKEEVRSFLLSSACFWCEKYHFDGIRMDAVSNIIYWGGNKSRGENQGALDFIRRFNYNIHKEFPSVMTIAEDSSDFYGVTHSTLDGGLGFDYKWDLGWMNDTLKYYKMDPIYRKYHQQLINFSMFYYYQERFILPFSHDEVVHGKCTIVDKMWGNYEQKFSQARNLAAYMMTHPGKKLNFMGNELGHFREWDEKKELDWFLLEYPVHDSFYHYIRDLNKLYNEHSCLYQKDYDSLSFKWIDADNADQSIFSYYREDENEVIVVVLNMTPNSYDEFLIGVPYKGFYKEILNSEKDIYSGCNLCNPRAIRAKKFKYRECDYAMKIKLAPFASTIFCFKKSKDVVK